MLTRHRFNHSSAHGHVAVAVDDDKSACLWQLLILINGDFIGQAYRRQRDFVKLDQIAVFCMMGEIIDINFMYDVRDFTDA